MRQYRKRCDLLSSKKACGSQRRFAPPFIEHRYSHPALSDGPFGDEGIGRDRHAIRHRAREHGINRLRKLIPPTSNLSTSYSADRRRDPP